MKRLDQLKDDLQEFDRQATGDLTLRVEWDFDRSPGPMVRSRIGSRRVGRQRSN